ncbi:MAG: DNA/RNA non-specific endonuclease, partial [Actinobacteria bacterium]|nr:DNA/RNA non-specific endonuclease [Actinomycetota bacterium]
MRFPSLFLTCVLWLGALPVSAQSLEDRVASLETQVADLWQLYDHGYGSGTAVPADLVGNEHLQWGYPGGDCVVLINDWFITCHDNMHRVPEWVSYHLTAESLSGDAERTDDFRPDPALPERHRAELDDYVGSGYDRGHMAPAAAFRRSEEAMSETFKLSNMAPQTPSLNRVMWRLLEDDVRELASKSANIWVFTGSLVVDEAGAL